ncbi:hypothetical protein ABPG72_014113 [Tetrahymena utriculariae]
MKAYQEKKNRFVAIKLMIVTSSDVHEDQILEYQKRGLIESQYVLENYDQLYDKDNQFQFIISKFCEKGNLFDYFLQNKNSLTNDIILNFCTQIIQGVIAIHDKNIVHSDLKPQNILINEDYQIKICDLGLSQFLKEQKSETFSKGGSYCYRAPEQDKGVLIKQCDVFGIGCIMCFLSNIQITILIATDIKNEKFPPIENSTFPELTSLAYQMMKKEPKKRINLNDCLEKLKQIQNNMTKNSTKHELTQESEVKCESQFKDGKSDVKRSQLIQIKNFVKSRRRRYLKQTVKQEVYL